MLCSFVNKECQGHLFSLDSKMEDSFHLLTSELLNDEGGSF